MSSKLDPQQRSGNVLLLTLFALVGIFSVLAFTVDISYLQTVNTELQRTADSAALSAAWELYRQKEISHVDPSAAMSQASSVAAQYAQWNKAGTVAPALPAGSVQVGFLLNAARASGNLDASDPQRFNAVRLTVSRTDQSNGAVPLFFARVFGLSEQALSKQATAMYLNNFSGFQIPSTGANLQILPFALDKQTWDGISSGGGSDLWKWDDATKSIVSGSDGIREVNLFPQGTGSPGNRGTVDIGAANNSTADITDQIYNGISAKDLQAFGKPLELDSNGQLGLNGDTGISASVQKALKDIKGQTRIIPVFDQVTGPGNNAQFRIVEFGGVRIMDVDLTGSTKSKRVLVQPANVQIKGGIPGPSSQTSQYIYSSVWLVR